MWLLVIILLQTVPGVERVTVLETYPSWETCRSERNRVALEMAASYPQDRGFRLECRPSSRHQRLV